MENVDVMKCSVDVSLTMIVKIKFTGIQHMDIVMDWVKNNLKCRFNEIETPLVEDSRKAKISYSKSKDSINKEKDMLIYTLRI